jgi:hydroxyacylglutathione hydrolase
VKVERLVLGDLETNCWLVSDGAGGPLVVIDPAGDRDDPERLVAAIGAREVAAVVLTHAHFDHLGSAPAVLEATGAPLLVHSADADRIVHSAPDGTGGALFGYAQVTRAADRLLNEGDRIEAGNLTLDVMLTPGHTRGSVSLLARDTDGGTSHLFSGDTLFAGSVGRTDFPGGDARDMRASIARLATLPEATVVHPGHGPDTTIARERRVNVFFPRA